MAISLTEKKFVGEEAVKAIASNVKTWTESNKSKVLKKVLIQNSTIKFYQNPDAVVDDTADYEIDLPTEYFLDQAKTTFVSEFAWSEETYPNSTNPSLDGLPVLVLAVKGVDAQGVETITYSFVSLYSIVQIYTADETPSTVTVTVDNSTNKIAAAVKISTDENNVLEVGSDNGLFADVSGKADKLVGEDIIKADQILIDNGSGNIAASGITIEDVANNMVEYTSDEINSMLADIL